MSATLLGNKNVSEQEVISVPDVPFTKSFHPIHHREIIGAIQEGIQAVGLEIVAKQYVLAQNGQRFFGVYDLSYSNGELCWSLGIRNSMNKSMSLGITAGTRVFVCENLCFSGEFLAFRRHTSGLDIDELAFLAYRSVRRMIPLLKAFQVWHEGLKGYPLTEVDSKILMVEIMTNNVIPASKFHQFNNLYGNVYDDSLWGFHETCTDLLRDSNLLTLPNKNKILNGVINDFITGRDEYPSRLGDFYESRAAIYR